MTRLRTLAQSEGDEIESARLAQRVHLRVAALERRGDVATARASLAAVNRTVTREDWNRHLGDDAQRLDVAYGWPKLRRSRLVPLLVLEWGALAALVVFAYRRGARRASEGRPAREMNPDGQV